MTLDTLNTMDCAAFTQALGWIFEHSPWVAERAWNARPFHTREALHHAMVDQVLHASEAEQLALIRAHPDLGARARMSDVSTAEQEGAGLDRLSPEEFHRLSQANQAYKDKFGFPFIFAVKGSTKHDIIKALETRLGHDRETERRTALEQIYRIAAFRLEDAIHA